jgi:DNA polymerase I-like protein with 3'-5' exonuclease and polymerase domains
VAAYYEHFTEKYEGVAKWHKKLGNEAMRFMKITNVSQADSTLSLMYHVVANGSVTHFTMIKNYPVQGFATGDVVPVVLIEIERRLWDMQSCIVNSVHDSVVIDVHPDETEEVIQTIKDMNEQSQT